jgi:hypothetical protein
VEETGECGGRTGERLGHADPGLAGRDALRTAESTVRARPRPRAHGATASCWRILVPAVIHRCEQASGSHPDRQAGGGCCRAVLSVALAEGRAAPLASPRSGARLVKEQEGTRAARAASGVRRRTRSRSMGPAQGNRHGKLVGRHRPPDEIARVRPAVAGTTRARANASAGCTRHASIVPPGSSFADPRCRHACRMRDRAQALVEF